MPPIVSIIGNSRSGKTTLMEKMIGELMSRGYKVATVKHAPHGALDTENEKDSQRYLQAGSGAAMVSSPDKIVLVKPVNADSTLDEITRMLGEDSDIILAEGFKQDSAPKIEVHRRETGPLLTDIKKLFAIVTDEPLETKTRQFALDDISGIVDLLEEGFIRPQRERLSFYVNDDPISLGSFPRDIITDVVVAMASNLKGVGEINKIEIFFKKGT